MIVLVLPDDSDDAQLLERARQGEKSAIGQIYSRHVESIYQYVRLRVGTSQAAEDITSSVFEALIAGLAQGKGPRSSLRGWLFQVARHTIADSYRREPPLPLDSIEPIAPDDRHPESEVMQLLDGETVRALIQMLSPDQQEVLLLRFDRQLSLRETASIMGKNINTVKTLQLRALQQLRRRLQRERVREENE